MRLEPLNQSNSKSSIDYIPASVRGIDESLPLRSLKSDHALRMVNLISDPNGLRSRPGQRLWTSGLPGRVTSMLSWCNSRNFAFCSGQCYEFKHGLVLPGFGPIISDRWLGDTLTNIGGKFLVATSDLDGVYHFDGSIWRESLIQGVDSRLLYCPRFYARRMWFTKLGSQDVYYLAAGAVSGPAKVFPLGPVFSTNAPVVAIGVIKGSENAKNSSDQIAFATSDGEVAIFAGTDPSVSKSWGYVGTFASSPPLGWRPLSNIGGELCMITVDGVISIPSSLPKEKGERKKSMLTTPIHKTFSGFSGYASSDAWQMIEYSAGKGGSLLNWPNKSPHILSRGAWSESLGLESLSWLESDGTYRGTSSGEIFKLGELDDDDGSPIVVVALSAAKHYVREATANQVRPSIEAPNDTRVHIEAVAESRFNKDWVPPWPPNQRQNWPVAWGTQTLLESKPIRKDWDWYPVGASGSSISVLFAANVRGQLIYSGSDVMINKG